MTLFRLFTVLLTIFFVCPASEARAADPAVFYKLGYSLYAGGLHALDADVIAGRSAENYEMALSAGTTSTFRLIAPWSGSFAVSGWILDSERHPEKYQSVSKGKKTKTKTYIYSRDGELVSFKSTENDKDETPEKIEPELIPQGIVDVLTATLQATDRLNAGQDCTGSALIFDGDRNFTLKFKDAGEENVAGGKYGVYQGVAKACTFEMVPGKGKWRKKPKGWLMLQAQARDLGSEPTVYFARVRDEDLYVPVKVQVKTHYGILLLHLTKYQAGNGETLVAPVKKDK